MSKAILRSFGKNFNSEVNSSSYSLPKTSTARVQKENIENSPFKSDKSVNNTSPTSQKALNMNGNQ